MQKQTTKQAEALAKKLHKQFEGEQRGSILYKWDQAQTLWELHSSVAWKMTKYWSFTIFVERELDIGYNAAIIYIAAHRNMTRLKYTRKELGRLAEKITFVNLAKIFSKMSAKVAVSTLLKQYAKDKLDQKMSVSGDDLVCINQWHFLLDDDHAKKLKEILELYGLRTHDSGKRNHVSSSMTKFLDSI